MEAHEGNMQANDDKGLEKLMDEYLRTCGFFRRKIAKDGSCLFRAVAEQVLHCQGLHMKVRAECVKYLRQERNLYESFVEGDFEEYLQRLQDPQSWVGQVEITALSVLYNRDFIIYQQPGEPPVNITENGYPDKVRLCFLNGNHYDSVYPLSYTTNAAFCQSILYELLYEKVFHVDQSVLAANMRSSKVRDAAEVEESRSISTAAVPHPVSAPAPPTAPVPAHVTAQGPETNLVGSQGAPGPGPVMVPPTDPPHEPLAVPVFEVPAGMPTHAPDLPTASGTPPTTVSAPTLSPHTTPPTVPSHSITSTDPANLPSAPAVAPFHPVGLGAFPGMQPPFPPYPPPVHPPTSGAMPTPPPAMSSGQTPPFSHPPEPRLYEAAAPSLVTGARPSLFLLFFAAPTDPLNPIVAPAGVGPVAVPEFQAHSAASPLRHAFSLLSQDPLYPGFPQSDKDDAVLPPPFSLHRTGKDLPKGTGLRWLGLDDTDREIFIAYTNQLWPPVTYLTPLTQAYHMQPNALPSWHPDQNPASLTHVSPAPNHNLMGPPVGAGGGPVNHFEVRGMTPGPPPVEVGGYSRHPHSVPMPMTPRPAVPWSAAHPPHVFQGVYSLPPPGSVPYSEAYAPTSVGHQRLPIPPPLHRRIDIAVATGPLVTERGEGDGQRSMTPQTEKHTWSGRSHLHPGGGDVKPAAVPVALPPAELQHDAGACAIAQAVLIGGATGEAAELTKLANGNAKEDEVTKSFQGGASGEMVSTLTLPCSATDNWEAEEAEYGDPDLRSGRLYYSQSYKSGGRRGHEDRGGFRGGGFRGRSRQHNQSVYHRAYRGRWRGRGYVQYSNTREAGYRGGQFAPSPET
uniref:ubiquitinyl hydrolase 1 n=1 Tax=Electrophorus electricus TaxID=8005 RepID=A0A4W4DR31_ELEEL